MVEVPEHEIVAIEHQVEDGSIGDKMDDVTEHQQEAGPSMEF